MQVALYTATFFAAIHAIWSLAVYLKVAGPYLTFILGLHFVNNPFMVKPFSIVTAAELVILVFVVWYVIAYAMTVCWNKMQKGK